MKFDWSQIQGPTVTIIGALLILFIGWLIARTLGSMLKKFLTNNKFMNEKVIPKISEKEKTKIPDIAGKSVYYLLMLLVFVGVFQVLGLTIITEPFNNFLNKITAYLPQLFGAVILLIIAWILATILRRVLLALLRRTKIDKQMKEQVMPDEKEVNLSTAISELAYWAVFILFLPAILTALQLTGLLSPVQNMVNIVLSFIPNLFAAALVVFIGWIIAKLIKNLVTVFLKSLRVDDFGKRTGLTVETNAKSLSEILGTVVYVLILIPVVISGLNILGIASIAQPATNMLTIIFNFIPSLFSAFIIIAFAYFIGKMVGDLVSSLLSKLDFNRILPLIGIKNAKIDLSQLVGKLIVIAIVLFAALESADVLGFSKLSVLIQQFIVFAGNILIGVVIIAFGLYIADLVNNIIKNSAVNNADTLALVSKVGLLILAITMGLSQMGLATNIIEYSFIFFVGALAVAFAIAFGIGGRDIAAKRLKEMDDKLNKKE
jgi:hypothetical protein